MLRRKTKRRPATPLVTVKVVSKRKQKTDVRRDENSLDQSIEIFRFQDDSPIPTQETAVTEKAQPVRVVHSEKPKERNSQHTFQLSDNEPTWNRQQAPHKLSWHYRYFRSKLQKIWGNACSTPLDKANEENVSLFKSVSPILNPDARVKQEANHDEERETKMSSAHEIIARPLLMDPKVEAGDGNGQPLANLSVKQEPGEISAAFGIDDKVHNSPAVKTEIKKRDFPSGEQDAKPNLKQADSSYPRCPLLTFSHKHRIESTVRVVRKKKLENKNTGVREYASTQCPLETLNFVTNKLRH